MRTLFATSVFLAVTAVATAAHADRYVLLAATKTAAFAADIDLRKDTPVSHVLYEVEKADLNASRARYTLITLEADCAARTLNVIQLHAMHSPKIEAGPPFKLSPEWTSPQAGTMEDRFLTAGCAPTFPKDAVIDSGDGDRDFERVLDTAIKTQLGMKPTDSLPKVRR